MMTDVTEIAAGIYRLSTFVKAVGPTGFTFNQFLIDAEEPLLFHYGQRALFPLVSEAVRRVVPLDRLRWTACSHVEGDESGALNEWLAAAPNATPAHGLTGCNIWLTDMADRAPRTLADGETLDLGGKRVRWLDTPHVPHNWDAGLLHEETTGTLFCSDLFTQMGPAAPTTESDIVAPAIATAAKVPFMPWTPMAEPTLRRLAGLAPTTLALMHGPTFRGDGAAALNGLADHYATRSAA
jgi:flavorubredoxin